MKVKIVGLKDLMDRITEYGVMFPKTYTTLGGVRNSLLADYERHGGTTALFGVQVSPEWEDRCYGFQYIGNGHEIVYKFVGMYNS
jgi:hypothetical protein